MRAIGDAARKVGAVFIASFDPSALGLLKRPGDYGADIAVAEGQGLGVPLGYGGPYLGILACRGETEYLRKIPGRLVGQTTDRNGKRCWVLTLQTREQHIRREKATSNICTNQGLLALRAAVYLTALGPQGLRETAELCVRKAHYAADMLGKIPGVSLRFRTPFVKEFTLKVPGDVPKLLAKLRAANYHAGLPLGRWYPNLADCISVAVTEKRTKAEIDGLAEALRTARAGCRRVRPAGSSGRRRGTPGRRILGLRDAGGCECPGRGAARGTVPGDLFRTGRPAGDRR
jgi:glycine dehydrogenase subunit 1